MWRYFTHHNTYRWLELLPKLLDGYNHSIHRSIATTPAQVNNDNKMEMWMRNEPIVARARHKLKIGDHVRISKVKGALKKVIYPIGLKKCLQLVSY